MSCKVRGKLLLAFVNSLTLGSEEVLGFQDDRTTVYRTGSQNIACARQATKALHGATVMRVRKRAGSSWFSCQ